MKNNEKLIILILGFMAFFANGDNYAVTPLLGEIANDLNITDTQASLSVTAYMLTFGLFTIFIGPMGDKYGRTRIINIAAFGTATFSCLGSVAFNLPSLILFRAMNGAFAAGIFPVMMAFIGEISTDKTRRGNFSFAITMMTLGAAFAMIIGGFLAAFLSWRMVYLVYGIAELIMALLMIKFLPKTEITDEVVSYFDTYKAAFTNRRLIATVSSIFIVGFVILGSFTFTGRMVELTFNLEVYMVGVILTFFGLGNMFGTFLPPRIPNVSRMRLVYTLGFGTMIGFVLLSQVSILAVVCFALFAIGAGFVNLQSTLIEFAQESLPQSRGTAMSLASFCIFVGGAVGTSVYKIVLENSSFDVMYLISAVFCGILLFKISLSKY